MSKNKGYSLIEIVVSLGLLAAGILSVLSLFSMATKTSVRSMGYTEATLLLQKVAEEIKLETYNNIITKNGVIQNFSPGETNLPNAYYICKIVHNASTNPDYKWLQVRITVYWKVRGKNYNLSTDVFLDFQ